MVLASAPQDALSGRSLRRLERLFSHRGQLREQAVALERQHRELLAIDFHAGLLEPVHHAAVAQPVLARERIDARDPERAKVALFLLAVTIGVGQAALERAAGLAIKLAATGEA